LVPKTADESTAIDNIVNSFKNYSYPSVVSGLPERTFPQNLWTIRTIAPNANVGDYLTVSWLGDPLPCVLSAMQVEKGDPSDPVVKVLSDGRAVATMLTLTFTEFETGTFVPSQNSLLSKSEVSYFGDSL
jgi:hypothetical protein